MHEGQKITTGQITAV